MRSNRTRGVDSLGRRVEFKEAIISVAGARPETARSGWSKPATVVATTVSHERESERVRTSEGVRARSGQTRPVRTGLTQLGLTGGSLGT